MKRLPHLTDEELVAHHYGEADFSTHLVSCASCAARNEALAGELARIELSDAPARAPEYAELTWSRIRAEILSTPRQQSFRFPRTFSLRYAIFASAGVLLLVTAFFAGRYWEKGNHHHAQTAHSSAPASPAHKPVVVVVLDDHLDRSEQFLVELKHADAEDKTTLAPLREEAKTLLVANRKFIEQPAASDDPQMQATLTKLDHLLVKLTADSENFTADDLAELKAELASDKLLFEIRVLRTTSQTASSPAPVQGTGERHGGTT